MATVKKQSAEIEETVVKEEKNIYEGYDRYIYIGPSLPSGEIKKNAVFIGIYTDILNFLSVVISKYPQIKNLIIPAEKLNEYAQKTKNSGNILNKYYNDINSAASGKKEVK